MIYLSLKETNTMKNICFKFFALCMFFGITSCVSSNRFIILQDVEQIKEVKTADFEVILQPDDLISIQISAKDPLIAEPYNLKFPSGLALSLQQTLTSYQVDQNGNITMPDLGTVLAAGKTRKELEIIISKLLEGKISNPYIMIRLLNFKITVQGEVKLPGVFTIKSDRITLFEAISMAGDLTVYGKRDNILIVREENGIKTFQKVDVTKADFINSPFYYLAQNDLIYVEPNKFKATTSLLGPTIGIIASVISLVFTIVVLIKR